jgi:nucleoside-diphosphate-sugar epimerase
MGHAVVTGSRGFLGVHLVEALAGRGDTVTALDIAVGDGKSSHPNVTNVAVDLRDAAAVQKAIAGADTVFHAASRVQTQRHGADEVIAVNVGGTRNVLAACRNEKVPRLVYVSSASVVYDGKDLENGDETLPYPTSFHAPYAETKATAEREVLKANGEGGVFTCSVRPHVVFGPGDGRFLPAVLGRAKSGKLKAYVGDAAKKSDFTFIDNLVHGLLLAQKHLGDSGPAGGQAYFITNGRPLAFWEFVGRFLDGMGYKRPSFRVPFSIAYTAAGVRETIDSWRGRMTPEAGFTRFSIRYLTTHHYFSIAKAKRDLGYEPIVDLDEGIARTLAALKA